MPWAEHPGLARLLRPLSWLYRLGWWLAGRWRRGPAWSAPVPVISVGNLSVGGTGKSPLVRALAAQLVRAKRRPAVLLRGYGARPAARPLSVSLGRGARVDAAASGDEAHEHAALPGLAVWIGADRRRSAEAALAAGAGCLLLDDGFQRRWQLARDLDLLLADHRELQGPERLLPAGPWREPWSLAARAHAVLISGAPRGLQGAALRRSLPPAWRSRPVFRLDLAPRGLQAWRGAHKKGLGWLRGKRVAALSGLGRPQRFEEALRALGADVRPWRFRDHHRFRLAELSAPPGGVQAIVSTVKDLARLPEGWSPALPVYALKVEAVVTPRAAFQRLLAGALALKPGS